MTSQPNGQMTIVRTEMGLTIEIGKMIRSLKLPTLFVQEGGYFVPALRENVRQMVVGFESI